LNKTFPVYQIFYLLIFWYYSCKQMLMKTKKYVNALEGYGFKPGLSPVHDACKSKTNSRTLKTNQHLNFFQDREGGRSNLVNLENTRSTSVLNLTCMSITYFSISHVFRLQYDFLSISSAIWRFHQYS
jgi:hypothetical protein